VRPGPPPARRTDGAGRAAWWARSRADQRRDKAIGWRLGEQEKRPRSRRTGVRLRHPSIRRGPPQRGQTRTSIANTRRRSRAQGQRREPGAAACMREKSACPFADEITNISIPRLGLVRSEFVSYPPRGRL